MEEVGKPLLPWQGGIVYDALGVRADGRWSAYEVVELVARQNGKGVPIEALELGGLYLLREEKVIHSAHLFDTSLEAFLRLVELIENCDWLRKRTNKINRSHGSEGIELTRAAGGGVLKYKARTVHGTRGFSGNRVILDEAYGLTVAQFQAISAILATYPNAQIIYASSPPDDKTGPLPANAMLPSIRKRGMAGDPRMAYYEWSPPPGFRPEDAYRPEVRQACNPSQGYLIDDEFLVDQLRVFAAAPGGLNAYATEHLGLWPDDEAQQWLVFEQDAWLAATDADSRTTDPRAFAIEVSLDRKQACVAVAGRRADGLRHIEIAEIQAGTDWVVGWVAQRVAMWHPCAVVVASGGPAGSLINDLEAAGIAVEKAATTDYVRACGALFDGINGEVPEGAQPAAVRDVRHIGQTTLSAAAAGARRLHTGTTWRFDHAGHGYLMAAAALALWGHTKNAPAWTGNYNPLQIY